MRSANLQQQMQGVLSTEECQDLMTMLKNWKNEGQPKTISVLQRLKQSQFSKEDFQKVNQCFKQFMKQIAANQSGQCASQDLINMMQQTRAYLKKTQEGLAKQKVEIPPPVPLVKKTSIYFEAQIPKGYGSALEHSRRTVLHNIFKSFIHNLEKEQKDVQLITEFVNRVEQHLYLNSKADMKVYNKMATKVLESLAPDKTLTAKLRMLKGQTLPKDVAEDKSKAFMSDEQIKQNEEAIKKQQKFFDVDFYARVIRANAIGAQFCRFCKKQNAAYCQYQKQTRRADEPMTRFMKCKECDRSWRD